MSPPSSWLPPAAGAARPTIQNAGTSTIQAVLIHSGGPDQDHTSEWLRCVPLAWWVGGTADIQPFSHSFRGTPRSFSGSPPRGRPPWGGPGAAVAVPPAAVAPAGAPTLPATGKAWRSANAAPPQLAHIADIADAGLSPEPWALSPEPWALSPEP